RRFLGCSPTDTGDSRRSVECRAYGARILFGIEFPALPGWADVWRSALRALHLWRSLPCHFSLNLPQTSRLLGMTKERATSLWKVVSGSKAFFTASRYAGGRIGTGACPIVCFRGKSKSNAEDSDSTNRWFVHRDWIAPRGDAFSRGGRAGGPPGRIRWLADVRAVPWWDLQAVFRNAYGPLAGTGFTGPSGYAGNAVSLAA